MNLDEFRLTLLNLDFFKLCQSALWFVDGKLTNCPARNPSLYLNPSYGLVGADTALAPHLINLALATYKELPTHWSLQTTLHQP